MSASLCDSCYAPGQCCKGFVLNNGTVGRGMTKAEVLELLKGYDLEMLVPSKVEIEGDQWRFFCTNLTLEGRCGDYENRPPICRGLEPASDQLCVHWKGAEGDERATA